MTAPADQVVDREAAGSLSADARRDHGLAGWIVIRDQPRPGEFTARLVTEEPTPYVLVAETLAGVRAQLPGGLERSARQPHDPPDLVEVWFAN